MISALLREKGWLARGDTAGLEAELGGKIPTVKHKAYPLHYLLESGPQADVLSIWGSWKQRVMICEGLQTFSSHSGHPWLGWCEYLVFLVQRCLRCGAGDCQHPLSYLYITACLQVPLSGCNQETNGLVLVDIIKEVIVTFSSCLNK